jgi:hypothetical protein
MDKRLAGILSFCFLMTAFHFGTAYCEEAEGAKSAPRVLKPVAVREIAVSKIRKIASVRPNRALFPVVLCWSPDDSTLFIAGEKEEKKRNLDERRITGRSNRPRFLRTAGKSKSFPG